MTTEPVPPFDNALQLRDLLLSGSLTATAVAEAALARIAAEEPRVRAWVWLDPADVREQAERLDARHAAGRPPALFGLPVGVKDVIDTAGIPTGNGTVLDDGRIPAADAAVVERLKAADALVMGKTVTTELALFHPSKTRNPADPAHSPGGSSAGSAAAVAAGTIPLALGTQTAGSVIRPAAFCGTTGFKPSYGLISRRGVLPQAPSLDTVGVFAADVAGCALLAEALIDHDPLDPTTTPAPAPPLLATALAEPPTTPRFALVRTPWWNRADAATRSGLESLAERLGGHCVELALPEAFAEGDALRQCIQFAELAHGCAHYHRRGADRLSPELRAAFERGAATSAVDYQEALSRRDHLRAALADLFAEVDALLTPAAPGPAPSGHASTGDPLFNGLWTLLGTPAVTLPLFRAGGLPVGAQLIGDRGDDARLLRAARWLERFAADDTSS